MDADRLFSELGYHKYIENEDTILYKKDGHSTYKSSISFNLKLGTFEGSLHIFVPKKENWEETTFGNEWLKYCSAQGHWTKLEKRFDMQELLAINQKCKELGWI